MRAPCMSQSRPSRPIPSPTSHCHRSRRLIACHAAIGQELPKAHKRRGAVDDSLLNKCRALVLDQGCRPVGIIDWKRAICLDLLEKVEVLEYYDISVRSVSQSHQLPAVLKAEFIMKSFNFEIAPSKQNIMQRDGRKCVYCSSTHDLTIDHVVPLSKGGDNEWDNLVTACKSCNCKKGNKLLKQLGWKLKRVPCQPTNHFQHLSSFSSSLSLMKDSEWTKYVADLIKYSV